MDVRAGEPTARRVCCGAGRGRVCVCVCVLLSLPSRGPARVGGLSLHRRGSAHPLRSHAPVQRALRPHACPRAAARVPRRVAGLFPGPAAHRLPGGAAGGGGVRGAALGVAGRADAAGRWRRRDGGHVLPHPRQRRRGPGLARHPQVRARAPRVWVGCGRADGRTGGGPGVARHPRGAASCSFPLWVVGGWGCGRACDRGGQGQVCSTSPGAELLFWRRCVGGSWGCVAGVVVWSTPGVA